MAARSAIDECYRIPTKLHALVYLTAALMLPNGMPATAMIQHESIASTIPDLWMANPAEVGALRTNFAPFGPLRRNRSRRKQHLDPLPLAA